MGILRAPKLQAAKGQCSTLPFTLIHGLIAFLIVALFTKDKRLLALAFWAGMMPDLDGLPILFNLDLYYAIHHELLHPLIYGVIFGVLFAFFLKRAAKMDFGKSFVVFASSYMLHPLTDVIFTNWPVKLFWPLSQEQHSWPILIEQSAALALIVIFGSAILLLKIFRKDIHRTLNQN